MKFAIATILFWESIGFNVEHWRQSEDGLLAMCHDEFARTIVPDLATNAEVSIYDIDSVAFATIIAERFTPQTIGEEIPAP